MSRYGLWGVAAAAALVAAPLARADDRTTQQGSSTSATGASPSATSTDASRDSTSSSTAGTGSTAASQGSEVRTSSDQKGTSKHDNSELLPKLYSANVLEIETAKIAQKNGQSQAVKDFAKQMEKDHGDMKDALAKIAKTRNVKLDDDKAKKEHQAHLDQMKGMKGADFDRHFASMMVSEHEKDLNDVKMALSQAKQSGDNELASVLENAQSKMKAHHTLAMDLDQAKGSQRQGRRPATSSDSTSGTAPSSTGTSSTGTSDSSGQSGSGSYGK